MNSPKIWVQEAIFQGIKGELVVKNQFKKSLLEGFDSLKSWFAFFGVLVAIVAVTNFIFSLLQLNISETLGLILDAYKAIIHGLIDWITWPVNIVIPWYIKDSIFLYGIVGGSFMRSRVSEGIYPNNKNKSIKTAMFALFFNKNSGMGTPLHSGRLFLIYKNSPNWLRKFMDTILWPRVAVQYLRRPCVYIILTMVQFKLFVQIINREALKSFNLIVV